MKSRTAELLLHRAQDIKAKRALIEPVLQLISDYMLFNRGDFGSNCGKKNLTNPRVFDSTAGRALTTIVSIIHSWMTSDANNWFRILPSNPTLKDNEEWARWFEEVTNVVHYVFRDPKTGFSAQTHELLTDWQGYGTGACFLEESMEDIVHFQARHLSEIYITENSSGRVDTVVRPFKYTVRQCAQAWPESVTESKQVSMNLDKNPDMELDIIQFVLPKEDYASITGSGSTVPSIFDFVSVYLLVEDELVLGEKGYYEMPFLVPRAEKITGEVYGRSNSWTNMPDILMINAMARTFIEGAQLSIRPPLLLPDDGIIKTVNVTPNGTIIGGMSDDGTELVKPLNMGNRLDIGFEIMEGTRKAIKEGFYVDAFLSREGKQPLTATEALIVQENKLRLISPQVNRFWDEYLTPAIKRTINALLRRNMLPPLPNGATEIPALEVRYISPLANIQNSQDLAAVQRFGQVYSPFIGVDPSVMDNVNLDEMVRQGITLSGLPLSLQRPQEEVAQIRQQRETEKQQQVQMQNAGMLADSAAKLQKAGIPVQ